MIRIALVLALLSLCAAGSFAQTKPPRPTPAQARAQLTRVLKRHAAMVDSLSRNLDARIKAVERRGPLAATDESVVTRDKAAMRVERIYAKREARLTPLATPSTDKIGELTKTVAANRQKIADRLKRLVELVPDLNPDIPKYWDTPPPVDTGPEISAPTNPTEFENYVMGEQPGSLDELLGAAAGVEERYLSTKK